MKQDTIRRFGYDGDDIGERRTATHSRPLLRDHVHRATTADRSLLHPRFQPDYQFGEPFTMWGHDGESTATGTVTVVMTTTASGMDCQMRTLPCLSVDSSSSGRSDSN
ncbi:hypothetical protein ACFQL7_26420 [Halocatena marina]|uniref:Uncharacterized protein n=1 Tax=Halocatena marina TaxID=2934937 RepID=A0ABD5YV63_9EURY